jgi:ABC-2 type transport system permease protein
MFSYVRVFRPPREVPVTPPPATHAAGDAEPASATATPDGPKGESAHPVIVSAIYAGTHVLVQLLFTPLLAGWAIWVGIAVSTRSTDVRVAQQLSVLGSLPPLAIVALMSLNVITESTALAIGLAAALLAFDLLAWRVVAAMFDRERLVTGSHG